MNDWKPKMRQVTTHFAEQIRGIRSGTISVGLIQTIRIDCQGRSIPINRLGAVKSQADRILITPFDQANVSSIVRALTESRLSAYALNPTTVCVGIPTLSVEQREETARHIKKLGEEAKIAIRSIRQQGASRSKSPAADHNGSSRRRPTRRSRRSNDW